jgi:hypothetical protein
MLRARLKQFGILSLSGSSGNLAVVGLAIEDGCVRNAAPFFARPAAASLSLRSTIANKTGIANSQ